MDLVPENLKQAIQIASLHIKLEIEDLNSFISSLKKREENFIQILDFSIKYVQSNAPEAKQTNILYAQMFELEKSRAKKEDSINEKYNGYKAIDIKQKK